MEERAKARKGVWRVVVVEEMQRCQKWEGQVGEECVYLVRYIRLVDAYVKRNKERENDTLMYTRMAW